MENNQKQVKVIRQMSNSFSFRLFCLFKIPLLAFTRVKIHELSKVKSVTKVPYFYLNKNPFRSMYFAVQSMAAELSTDSHVILAINGFEENIAYIVTACDAQFYKKVDSTLFFECCDYTKIESEVKRAVNSGEGVEVQTTTIGRNIDGLEMAKFTFTWSFKVRSK